jgi:hypothetical protein
VRTDKTDEQKEDRDQQADEQTRKTDNRLGERIKSKKLELSSIKEECKRVQTRRAYSSGERVVVNTRYSD